MRHRRCLDLVLSDLDRSPVFQHLWRIICIESDSAATESLLFCCFTVIKNSMKLGKCQLKIGGRVGK